MNFHPVRAAQHILLPVLLGCAAMLAADCAGAAGEPALTPLFANEAPLEIAISGPLTSVIRDTSEEPEYREGTLRVIADGEAGQALAIKLRPRGRSRRDTDVCTFPPLRLNFAKKAVAGTVFEGQDKLKLVTHCRDRNRRFEQFVLQEYLLYRALNALTENSFRVRLVNVEYTDTDGKRKPARAPGFLIEHDNELARRRGFEVAEVERIEAGELEPGAAALLGVFEYMIGNTDWEALAGPAGDACCHNVVPFVDAEGRYVAIPYDFDSTGVIDPPYAAPHELLKIRSVRTRLYRGYCQAAPLLDETLELVDARRETIYGLFRAQAGLDEKTVDRSLEYFDDFYAVIDDPRRLDREIRQACRE